jgi:hypothetical protein
MLKCVKSKNKKLKLNLNFLLSCVRIQSYRAKTSYLRKILTKSTFPQLTKVFHKRFGECFLIIPIIFFLQNMIRSTSTTWASSLLSKRYSKCVACISRIHLFNVTSSKLIKLFHPPILYIQRMTPRSPSPCSA